MSAVPSCPVLLVEDDPAFRKPLVIALDESHFSVTVAEDAAGAIEELEKRTFQVIILDLALRSGSGIDVISYIRDHREKVGARVLVVTGAAEPARAMVDTKIADEILLKPVDFSYIATRARRYCGHPGS